MNQLRSRVIGSYMRLLRTEKLVFNNDKATLAKVTQQARTQYRENKSVEDPVKIDEMVQHADAVSDFLLTSTIQAVKKTDTKFGTERLYEFVGDQPKKRVRQAKGPITIPEGCCGGGACGSTPGSSGCS
ncbi:LYR motif-containing protein 7 [Heterostelium album PN500]|uniref:LYR motif-containing protein 7 n=1 Tax=Heterostelium pallidum (strain ATCC 26659 / Pp 5 / PN500) TaxID=670386 RepID=D3BPW4_HETP5|nr:LYR motif-containing protein 7 [Heterostelium album PN500]EFA76247.1 LYR motif-containing protein 7 [Heterostelium album PN500]|eukprot:XP_020428380.1 LYR motif-containing protein 7 [Heterostelium album PN500]